MMERKNISDLVEFAPEQTPLVSVQKNKKTLALGIPTHNRSKALNRFLLCISNEMREIEDEIEICLSDNASTDDTPQIISKWGKILDIRRAKTRENYGNEINTMITLSMARAEFFWFLGDDDLLVEGTLKKLVRDLKSLQTQNVNAIYIPSGPECEKLQFGGIRIFKITDKAYPPLMLGYGSTAILRTKAAQNLFEHKMYIENYLVRKKHRDRDVLNNFVHAYMLLELAQQTGNFGIVSYSGVIFLGDGEAFTYEKMLWIYLVAISFNYDLKRYYPWFKADTAAYKWNTHFVSLFLVSDRPDLEPIFSSYFSVLVRYMELENKKGWLWLMKAINSTRKIPPVPFLIILTYSVFRLCKKIHAKPDLFVRTPNGLIDLERKLKVAIQRAKKLCAEHGYVMLELHKPKTGRAPVFK